MEPVNEAVVLALALAQQEYYQAMETRTVVEVPPAESVLLIGPHPDDIVLGCGGTVLKYRAAGVPVDFLCLTDGRACVAGPAERARIVAVREAEEREAARLCGARSVDCFLIPEDQFADSHALPGFVDRLEGLLASAQVDSVFVPYWLELHPLHRYAAHLLARTLERCNRPLTIYSYEVVSILPPALVVDISEVFETKLEAVRVYRSQLAFRDYTRDVSLLNGQRARLVSSAARAAEVFFGLQKEQYVSRVLSLGLERPSVLGGGAQPMLPES